MCNNDDGDDREGPVTSTYFQCFRNLRDKRDLKQTPLLL